MSSKSFTARQGQYLAFIDVYTRVHGRPPAETDMQRHFQLTPPSVHQMVLTLERLGHIRRQPGVARSIEVLLAPEDLPVLRYAQPAGPVAGDAQPFALRNGAWGCVIIGEGAHHPLLIAGLMRPEFNRFDADALRRAAPQWRP